MVLAPASLFLFFERRSVEIEQGKVERGMVGLPRMIARIGQDLTSSIS